MSRKYAILGETLKHTMSPPIHKRLFELRGREFEYEIVELTASELENKADYLNSMCGYNITIPHKVEIIKYLDSLDESAKRYNSVNCVDNKNGVLTGYNTDCDGFLQTVYAMGAKLSGEVLLVGCGGVGRMIAIESALEGASLNIAVLESDMPLAVQVEKEIKALKPDAKISIVLNTQIDLSKHYDLLINACPVGMYPKSNACPVSDEVIDRCDAVFDVVYNPCETLLVKKAKEKGKKAVGGMAMLVWQAVSAHKIWDGDEYTNEEIDSIIDEMNEIVKRDFK
ncbi:MAG: shikimate dehydrogenase [Ruminococcus sp.]|nr:shikimate dehydrogenase [Ruminococcus sp.]